MSTLVVLGASGLAREALAVPGVVESADRVVVLDDDPHRWGGELGGHPVAVGGLDVVRDVPDARPLLCFGSGQVRRQVAERLLAWGIGPDRYATVRHPSVAVPAGCSVGAGSILLARVTLTCDVGVGRHVVAMPGVTLTHDVVVEDFATLCAAATFGGSVHVGSGAYVGMSAAVRQGVRIGRDATLGMGAVLLEDLPATQTWAGVPARPLRALSPA